MSSEYLKDFVQLSSF